MCLGKWWDPSKVLGLKNEFCIPLGWVLAVWWQRAREPGPARAWPAWVGIVARQIQAGRGLAGPDRAWERFRGPGGAWSARVKAKTRQSTGRGKKRHGRSRMEQKRGFPGRQGFDWPGSMARWSRRTDKVIA